ncbi:MAG: MAPEG family protein [Gammaproteobacteria bacterium]|nr:MAPEG family protein [Gammaproteobacteria bacterium]MDH5276050.1 MAPEG family protein [Gammaproteobacteria bacterium]
MSVQITAIYASVLAIVFIALSYRVAQRRMRFQVGLGTGENRELERAIRIHGNFAEYVPLALLLLALYESGGGPGWAVHTAGAALLVARALHAVGLTQSSGRSTGRFTGILSTWLVILGLALANLARVLA